MPPETKQRPRRLAYKIGYKVRVKPEKKVATIVDVDPYSVYCYLVSYEKTLKWVCERDLLRGSM